MTDPWDTPEGRTYSMPVCEQHPPFTEWDAQALIQGRCPKCGQGSIHGTWRELAARRLIAEAEGAR